MRNAKVEDWPPKPCDSVGRRGCQGTACIQDNVQYTTRALDVISVHERWLACDRRLPRPAVYTVLGILTALNKSHLLELITFNATNQPSIFGPLGPLQWYLA